MEASAEFDNRPGPVRDLIAETMGMWMGLLVEQSERALERGELAPGTDPKQLAWELHAFGLALNWDRQLNGAAGARSRAATAVRARLDAAATAKGRAAREVGLVCESEVRRHRSGCRAAAGTASGSMLVARDRMPGAGRRGPAPLTAVEISTHGTRSSSKKIRACRVLRWAR